jgi:hypothetical protein
MLLLPLVLLAGCSPDPRTDPRPVRVVRLVEVDPECRSTYYALRSDYTIVESVETGERMIVNGWIGEPGDEFTLFRVGDAQMTYPDRWGQP